MKYMYKGLFLTKESEKLLHNRGKLLIKKAKNLHITFQYGSVDLFPSEMMEKIFTVRIIGEGKSKKNHGYLVELPEELTPYYPSSKKPYITVSLGKEAKSFRTGELEFSPIKPFEVEGKLGYFTNEGTVSFQ